MAAELFGLGRTLVAVGGTPVQVAVPADLVSRINPPSVHAIVVEALFGNTGKIFVGVAGLNRSTLVNCLVVLPIPTANLIPTFSISVAAGANPLYLPSLWIDADINNEGVLISCVLC